MSFQIALTKNNSFFEKEVKKQLSTEKTTAIERDGRATTLSEIQTIGEVRFLLHPENNHL